MNLPDTNKENYFEGYERIPQETQFERIEDKELIDYSTQLYKIIIKE